MKTVRVGGVPDPENVDLSKYPIHHIVEEVGTMDQIVEVDSPSEGYYTAYRRYLEKKHPEVSVHFMDHMISTAVFLDRSIVSGFSFGVSKAQVAVTEGKLLGNIVSRSGMRPDPERVQAVKDFPPLKEKTHVMQFLGCTNWLRSFLYAEYVPASKILGKYQRDGMEFPEGGIGAERPEGPLEVDKALKRSK